MNHSASFGIAILVTLGIILSFASRVHADETISTGSKDAANCYFGYVTVYQYCGVPFTTVAGGDIVSIDISVQEDGSDTDDFYIEIYDDSGGNPSVLQGTSDTVDAPPTATTKTSVTFSSPVFVAGGTKYWAVYKRTGFASVTDFYDIYTGAGSGDPAEHFDGSWVVLGNPGFQDVNIESAGPPSGGGGGSATSTVDQVHQNLYNGFVVFFAGFFGTLWMLRRKV